MRSMRKSQLSKPKQDCLIEHFVAGATARCAVDLVRVNPKTAVYYFHRLHEIIAYQLEQEADAIFSGEIKVDESYFGGKCKGQRGRGAATLLGPGFFCVRVGRHLNLAIIATFFSASLYHTCWQDIPSCR